MAIFNSYVSLPEAKDLHFLRGLLCEPMIALMTSNNLTSRRRMMVSLRRIFREASPNGLAFQVEMFFPFVLNKYDNYKCLVGGLEHFLLSIIYGIILPIDSLTFIFFKMVIAPPTRCFAANHSLWTEGDHHDAQQVRYQWTARE